MYGMRTYSFDEVKGYLAIESLQQQVLRLSFFNLLLVAFLGIALRSFPFLQQLPLDYKNLLHGHSHFAFGGWMMPVLFGLFLRSFPAITEQVGYHHWRNIAVLMFASAFGMLLSFPVQGYKAVSIVFSTLSLISGFYWMIVAWKPLTKEKQQTSSKFLKWAFIYFALSSIGPFATGPLIAMGKQGSPLYFDSIYFYLHFQYNGFFSFLVLAMLYKKLESMYQPGNGRRVFRMLNAAIFPTFLLSVLWHPHPGWFNLVGGAGALLQMIAVFFLVKDFQPSVKTFLNSFFVLALAAFVLKLFLQLVSAFQAFASTAYENRNFVIAYLHLVLLGFLSSYVFSALFQQVKEKLYRKAFWLFTASLVIMLGILAMQAGLAVFKLRFYLLNESLLVISVMLFAGLAALFSVWRRTVAVSNS